MGGVDLYFHFLCRYPHPDQCMLWALMEHPGFLQDFLLFFLQVGSCHCLAHLASQRQTDRSSRCAQKAQGLLERDSLGNAKVVKIFRKQQTLTLLERDGVGNVKVVKIFNSRKQQALLERDGLGNAKKNYHKRGHGGRSSRRFAARQCGKQETTEWNWGFGSWEKQRTIEAMTDQFATNAGVLDWGLRLRARSSVSQRMIGSPWHWFFASHKIKGHSDNRMLHLLAQIHQYPLNIIESCTAGLENYGLDCKPKLRRTNHTKQVARFFVMGSRFCVGSLCLWSGSIRCTKLPWGLSRRCKAWQHISAPGSQKACFKPDGFCS